MKIKIQEEDDDEKELETQAVINMQPLDSYLITACKRSLPAAPSLCPRHEIMSSELTWLQSFSNSSLSSPAA